MPVGLSTQILSELSRSVAEQTGLYYPPERWVDLERGIHSAASKLGCADIVDCSQRLLTGPLHRKQIEILAGELTVGETYFFRDNPSFEILRDHLLPELVRAREKSTRHLRIWSAGCCTGEEPYSIAILLDRFFPMLAQWHVTILATDLNPYFLRKASAGVFGEWSFRDCPSWLKDRYFKTVAKGRFELISRIKEKVTFGYLNLAEDCYPNFASNTNAMDLILCRNVLMYFSPQRMKVTIDHFHHSLTETGWLLVGPSEVSSEIFSSFTSVHFSNSILYHKGTKPLRSVNPVSSEFDESSSEAALLNVEKIPESETEQPPMANVGEELELFKEGPYVASEEKLSPESDLTRLTERLLSLARTCANLGNLADAHYWIEKAITSDKLNPETHFLRALIFQEQGDFDESVAALKRAIYLSPDFVMAHFVLGNLSLQGKNEIEADRHFSNARRLLDNLQPSDVIPHSDGLVAGRLRVMIESIQAAENLR